METLPDYWLGFLTGGIAGASLTLVLAILITSIVNATRAKNEWHELNDDDGDVTEVINGD